MKPLRVGDILWIKPLTFVLEYSILQANVKAWPLTHIPQLKTTIMKQLFKSPRMSLIILAILAVAFVSCSGEKDVQALNQGPGGGTGGGNPTNPNPTGTITPVASSIGFNGTAGFTVTTQNATAVYIGGLPAGINGPFSISGLKDTTTYICSIAGSTGTVVSLPSITINVDRDPRVVFLLQGMSKAESTFFRKKGTLDPWTPNPNGSVDNYVYKYNDVPDGPPGSSGVLGNRADATSNGSPINFKWYFSGDNFEAHGVSHYRFTITSNTPTLKTYELYRYGIALIGSELVDVEVKETFKIQ